MHEFLSHFSRWTSRWTLQLHGMLKVQGRHWGWEAWVSLTLSAAVSMQVPRIVGSCSDTSEDWAESAHLGDLVTDTSIIRVGCKPGRNHKHSGKMFLALDHGMTEEQGCWELEDKVGRSSKTLWSKACSPTSLTLSIPREPKTKRKFQKEKMSLWT